MNNVEAWKPTLSKSSPETVGPMKAPRANVEVHIADTRPYVSMELGRPLALETRVGKCMF